MSDDLEPGPFAEFAAPKKGAVEQWRERQVSARRSRRQILLGLCCIVAGATLGTSIAVCVRDGLRPLLPLFGAALLGAVGGLMIGGLIGCACFSIGASSIGARSWFRRDPMSVMTVLVAAGTLIGVTSGAAWGGLKGVSWFLGKRRENADLGIALAGSFAGVVLLGFAWLLWTRYRARHPAGDRHDLAD